MNKKYLILKRPVIKAAGGWGTSWVSRQKKEDLAFQQYGDSYLNSVEGSFEQKDMLNTASQERNSKVAGVAGAAVAGLDMLTDPIFDKISEGNYKEDSFGNEILDKQDVNWGTARGFVSGSNKGFEKGMQVGGPWGALIGAAIGGVTGLIGGRKKAKEAKEASEKLYGKNIISTEKRSDLASTAAIYGGKLGIKLKKKNLGAFTIQKKKSSSLIMKEGGKLETPGEVNVVVKGKMHRENNNLGNKDKGVPVVDAQGNKEYEVEKGEIILRHDVTILAEKYAAEYKATGNDDLLVELGETIAEELLKNTQDNDGKFGVKVKEDED